jgi:CBS domain-containing protein
MAGGISPSGEAYAGSSQKNRRQAVRPGKAKALTIYLGESDQWRGRPLYVAIMQFLREQGCAGATATRAVAGYGAAARLHEEHGLRWSSDATIVIQVIDQPQRLQRLLPHLQEMLLSGLITLHEVEVITYPHLQRHGLPAHLTVRQVMEPQVTTVEEETPLARVVDLLLGAPFRALPVVDAQRRLLGIITTGDLIRAGVLPLRRGLVRTALELDRATAEAVSIPLEEARQSPRTALDVMNRQVRSVRPEQSVREAARLMVESDLRRLPVVTAEGQLVGMLSRADLLQSMMHTPLSSVDEAAAGPVAVLQEAAGLPPAMRPVVDYLQRDIATVREDTPLDDVLDALILSSLKRVLVVDEARRLLGIISDVDVLARLQEEMRPRLLELLTNLARSQGRRPLPNPFRAQASRVRRAADLMNRAVVTVPTTATVQEAIERMINTRRKVVPVVDAEGRPVGVVGRSDLLRALLEEP